MDAEKAVNLLGKFSNFISGPLVVLSLESAQGIANFINQQEKFAELGQLAMTANVCGLVFADTGSISCTECSDYHFCKLRTELLADIQS